MSQVFKAGDRVKVSAPASSYHDQVGTVASVEASAYLPVQVVFEDARFAACGEVPFAHDELTAA